MQYVALGKTDKSLKCPLCFNTVISIELLSKQ